MKTINILVLLGIVLSIFLVSGCNTKPTVLPGNQIDEGVQENTQTTPPQGNPTQLPLISKTDANGNIVGGQEAEKTVEQPVEAIVLNITGTTYNYTILIQPINITNVTTNYTGNYSNNTNLTI